jgi:hypothetical protein
MTTFRKGGDTTVVFLILHISKNKIGLMFDSAFYKGG